MPGMGIGLRKNALAALWAATPKETMSYIYSRQVNFRMSVCQSVYWHIPVCTSIHPQSASNGVKKVFEGHRESQGASGSLKEPQEASKGFWVPQKV